MPQGATLPPSEASITSCIFDQQFPREQSSLLPHTPILVLAYARYFLIIPYGLVQKTRKYVICYFFT